MGVESRNQKAGCDSCRTVPAIAEGLEKLRSRVLVFCYQLYHIRSGKSHIQKSLAVWTPELERYTGLVQQIKEKRKERKALVAEKANAGAEAFRKDIATMEAGLKKLKTQEQKYSVEQDKALTEYAELKMQASELDPAELYEARQAIRPAQEKAAEQQLEDALHEKLFLLMLFSAKQEGLVYLERIQKNGSCVNFCSSPCDQPICAI